MCDIHVGTNVHIIQKIRLYLCIIHHYAFKDEGKWKYDGHTESHGPHETVNKGQAVLHCAMYDDYFHVLSYSSIYVTDTCHTVIIQCEKMAGKNITIQQCAAT